MSILIPLGIGIWLDRRLGTAPLFILIGALVGILASTIGAVRIASRTIEALGNLPDTGSSPDEVNRKEDQA
jgi:F0F1-type ATP synthase assembly protein I